MIYTSCHDVGCSLIVDTSWSLIIVQFESRHAFIAE
jgi:hypothetical protein